MKNWKFWIFLLFGGLMFGCFRYCKGQNNHSVSFMGSCAIPNGPVNETFISPPNYTWLQDNGYCNPGAYGKNGTVCWTFISPGVCIDLNSGWASSGCAATNFGPFNLYTCAPACVNIGTGLSYCGLTSGICYTWCMGYSAAGPPGCQFTDFCPYYQEISSLPIELLYFKGYNNDNINIIEWETTSNAENNYYTLEFSFDTKNWIKLAIIEDDGVGIYQYRDSDYFNQVNYYRLKQTDFDGTSKYYGIVAIDNFEDFNFKNSKFEVYNLFGQLVLTGDKLFNLELLIANYMPSGVYLIKQIKGSKLTYFKIIKS